jgi:hypothetical protein
MNIFYSEIDNNLQQELDARAAAGTKNRTERDLDFMLGKIANVEISAFDGENAQTPIIQTLGGQNVQQGRYLPSGKSGFLNETPYTQKSIQFDSKTNTASSLVTKIDDKSYRIGPYVKSTTIDIGDHSMGLLNKASVDISIPNPLRDLDEVETVWFRPGRYARIVIAHPDSAIITKNNKMYPNAKGELSRKTIPNREKLKEFYPEIAKSGDKALDDFENQLVKMNYVMFEGLITSFNFSYTADGTIDASISLTGTSNIYTDISMFMPQPANVKDNPSEKEKPKVVTNPVLDPKIDLTKRNTILDELVIKNIIKQADADTLRTATGDTLKQRANELGLAADTVTRLLETESSNAASEFYEALDNAYPFPKQEDFKGKLAVIKKTAPLGTDRFFLAGPPFKTITSELSAYYQRYITLGTLIDFLNNYVLKKLSNTVTNAKIICHDARCYSVYYDKIVSSNPWEVLLLDNALQGNVRNSYGNLNFFDVNEIENIKDWSGISGNYKQIMNTDIYTSADSVIFPSRILISLDTIREIILGKDGNSGLASGGKTSFTVKSFLSAVSAKIGQATGNAIFLSLVTDPDPTYQNVLIFADTKYVTRMDNEKNKKVEPYSVPMFANNPRGTLVRDFTLSAQLPENAKNLAYTLNGADKDGFEDEIAPYLNFMYQQGDADGINKTITKYKENNKTVLTQLNVAKIDFGAFPQNPEKRNALRNAIIKYIKYPTDDIKLSSLMTAPIFPFTAEFTIDGINGLRYGDVVTFEALPYRYRVNTVFSIIGITHSVDSNGLWTTQAKCIMRPSLE